MDLPKTFNGAGAAVGSTIADWLSGARDKLHELHNRYKKDYSK